MPVKIKSFDDMYCYVYDEETGKFVLVGKVSDIGEYDGERE